MANHQVCPLTQTICESFPSTQFSAKIEGSTVKGVVAMQIGEYVALANLTRGKVCPLVDTLSGVIAPKVGDVVPLQLNQGGVATRIGPTVSTACVELHPWG